MEGWVGTVAGLADFCQSMEKTGFKNRGGKNSICHLNLRLSFFDKRLVLSYYLQLWIHLFSVTKFVLLTYLLTKNMYNV